MIQLLLYFTKTDETDCKINTIRRKYAEEDDFQFLGDTSKSREKTWRSKLDKSRYKWFETLQKQLKISAAQQVVESSKKINDRFGSNYMTMLKAIHGV